jgi:hypothetical protein
MKRRAMRLLLFVLLGAIINVAVAWVLVSRVPFGARTNWAVL